MDRPAINELLHRLQVANVSTPNARVKTVVDRIVRDLFYMIEDLDVQPDEFWAAVSYLTEAGQTREFGLIAPGLGLEHFLDLRMDEVERAAGAAGSTPRTIEGPLYVAGAPVSCGEARLDDGSEQGEALVMHGQVRDVGGQPVPGATVEVWHANTLGGYSFFDTSQVPFNLRRTIIADDQGRYKFRTIMPSGYACPPGGPTQKLLDMLGRHGRRPAHIHFFVSAPGFRKLTTQINIDGDAYLHDDFAFATRDGLIPPMERVNDPDAITANRLEAPFARIMFNFSLQAEATALPKAEVTRAHAEAA